MLGEESGLWVVLYSKLIFMVHEGWAKTAVWLDTGNGERAFLDNRAKLTFLSHPFIILPLPHRSQIKPYVEAGPSTYRPERPRLPSFSPRPPRSQNTVTDRTFSKRYAALRPEEQTALIMKSRRDWWQGLTKKYGDRGV
jgi:hypothetical protein